MDAVEFTPTTSDVRSLYVLSTPAHAVSISDGKAEFDRWLEQVKTEAKAEALEEAAAELDKSKQPSRHGLPMMLRADWLRNRAEHIRKESKAE